MIAEELKPFRLVGGTSLSLQIGHRESVDIDLFTDELYGKIDFKTIELFLEKNFTYVDFLRDNIVGMGKSYYIGDSADDAIKLDLFYTDSFIRPVLLVDKIRFATIDEIVAMKLEIFTKAGRKKDFWDLHQLFDRYTIEEMLKLHEERYPYTHNREQILANLTVFNKADRDIDPNCFRYKYWETIKLDFVEKLKPYY